MTHLPSNYSESDLNATNQMVWRKTWWGAIFAGALTAVGLQFLFTVLGLAIGITAATAASDSTTTEGADSIGVAAAAWWLISGLTSLLIGGCVLGRLWGPKESFSLCIHAFALWSAVALFGFVTLWSGAGVAAAARTPLAVISLTARDRGYPDAWRAGSTGGLPSDRPVLSEDERDAAKTAAWWSFAALLLGVGATMGGARVGAHMSGMPVSRHRGERQNTFRPATLAE